jgi:branched-chain amino acid transport system substrate-binding protein
MKRSVFLSVLVFFLAVFIVYPCSFAMAAEPVVIGVPTSLGFLEGGESLKAVILAAEEINAKGGVNLKGGKRPLKVEKIDTRDAAPGVPVTEALLAVEKMILDKKVKAILVGPFSSEGLISSMDTVCKYRVPMLATIGMAPAYTVKVKQKPERYKYCFRVAFNAVYLVRYLASSMKFIHSEFGFNKAFIIIEDRKWARATGNLVKKMYFDKAGWEVVGFETYPLGASDFSAGLMKARQKGAQVLLPIFAMPESGILIKQWNAMKIPTMVVGFISPLAGSKAWQTFDGKIGGFINVIFEIGDMPSEKLPRAASFYNAYKKRWGEELQSGHGPAPSYDAVYVLKEAIERAGSVEADALVTALEKTQMEGVMGKIKFGKDHQVIFGFDPKETAIGCVYQWRKPGKRVIVYPEPVAEAKIILPAGLKAAK